MCVFDVKKTVVFILSLINQKFVEGMGGGAGILPIGGGGGGGGGGGMLAMEKRACDVLGANGLLTGSVAIAVFDDRRMSEILMTEPFPAVCLNGDLGKLSPLLGSRRMPFASPCLWSTARSAGVAGDSVSVCFSV